MEDYVFTYASWAGPCVHRFESADRMLSFVNGWTCFPSDVVSVVSAREIRA